IDRLGSIAANGDRFVVLGGFRAVVLHDDRLVMVDRHRAVVADPMRFVVLDDDPLIAPPVNENLLTLLEALDQGLKIVAEGKLGRTRTIIREAQYMKDVISIQGIDDCFLADRRNLNGREVKVNTLGGDRVVTADTAG